MTHCTVCKNEFGFLRKHFKDGVCVQCMQDIKQTDDLYEEEPCQTK